MSKRFPRRSGGARSSESLSSSSPSRSRSTSLRSQPVFDRSSAMLASEAREVLSLALSEALDPCLEDVVLEHVDARPSGIVATLLVPPSELEAARAALDRLRPHLRGELAGALHRRRVPELSLLLWPATGPAGEEPERDE